MTDAAVIRLRTIDLTAQTVHTLLERAAGAPPIRLERRIIWMVRYADGADGSVVRARLAVPGVLHNPNKESLTIVEDAHAPLVPARAGDACIVVWSRDRAGRVELAAALHDDVSAIADAEHITLWWMRATAGGDVRAFAEEVACVRDRRHGVLINPHLSMGGVLNEAPTIARLAGALWPEEAHMEAER